MNERTVKFLSFTLILHIVGLIFLATTRRKKSHWVVVNCVFTCPPDCQERMRMLENHPLGQLQLFPPGYELLKRSDVKKESKPSPHQRVRVRLTGTEPTKPGADQKKEEEKKAKMKKKVKPKLRRRDRYILYDFVVPFYGVKVKIELLIESI